MRISEFNLRVWDERDGVMIEMDQILKWENLNLLFSQDDSVSVFKRMRSIGFCDIHGKEIYQKDFIQIHCKGGNNVLRMVDWIPELAKFGWAGAYPGGTPYSFSSGNGKKIFEIVGDYYKSPESR